MIFICFHVVKLFQVFLSNAINFQAALFVPKMEPESVLTILVIIDLGVMPSKGYFIPNSPSALELELHYWRQLLVIFCYGDISYHTPKMDSSNLNIFAELSLLGEDNFSFLTRHLTDRLQAENG